MDEWILSCRRALRLFLRRIYVKQKTHRERQLTRPLLASDGNLPTGHSRTFIFNLTLISIPLICYFFLLPPSASPPAPSRTQNNHYKNRNYETAVVIPPEQMKNLVVPKHARIKLAKNWLIRNAPELKDLTENIRTAEVPTTTKRFAEQAKHAQGAVIFIMDDKTTPGTTVSPTSVTPTCVTRAWGGKIILNTSIAHVSLDSIYPMVQDGGHYIPSHCNARHKVAILVPYRNRSRNLSIFLYNIHPILMEQDLEYRVFVIEQFGNGKFNKGRLFNSGFKEMPKFGSWHCVVFHDVDLLPTDHRIFYTCPRYPRHMSSYVYGTGNRHGKNTSSPVLFGGVTAMSTEHYKKANGHSNMYWGWGGEDYDMFWRIRAAGIPVMRYNKTIAKYFALPHPDAKKNPDRYTLLHSAVDRWQDEGLNNIDYKVVSVRLQHLFTHILIDIQLGETSNANTIFKSTRTPNKSNNVVKTKGTTTNSKVIVKIKDNSAKLIDMFKPRIDYFIQNFNSTKTVAKVIVKHRRRDGRKFFIDQPILQTHRGTVMLSDVMG